MRILIALLCALPLYLIISDVGLYYYFVPILILQVLAGVEGNIFGRGY